jgi:hypothetical protein
MVNFPGPIKIFIMRNKSSLKFQKSNRKTQKIKRVKLQLTIEIFTNKTAKTNLIRPIARKTNSKPTSHLNPKYRLPLPMKIAMWIINQTSSQINNCSNASKLVIPSFQTKRKLQMSCQQFRPFPFSSKRLKLCTKHPRWLT